jgi:hypothetical protein
MTSLEDILENFYFEPLNENKYPKFGKADRQDYLFTCKHCKNTSEPMKFESDIKYRLASHLTRYCHPSSSITEEQQGQEQK